MTTVIDGTTGVNRIKDDTVVMGDIVFGGPASRIYGDFSNSNETLRLAFQSSVVNGYTALTLFPNGTSSISAVQCWTGTSANESNVNIYVDGTLGTANLVSGIRGTGTALPLTFLVGGAERMRIEPAGTVKIGQNTATTKLDIQGAEPDNVNAILTHMSSDPNFQLWVRNGSAGAASGTVAASMVLAYKGIGLNGEIDFTRGDSATNGDLVFKTANTERLRILSDGIVLIGKPTTDWQTPGFMVTGDTHRQLLCAASIQPMEMIRTGTDGAIIQFYKATSACGNITITSTSTLYNTASDYRLKQNVRAMIAPLTRLLRLKPIVFNWRLDDSEGEGFLAHELQVEVPLAVFGEKDAVRLEDDIEGKAGDIIPQGVDLSKLVPLLVAAVQELSQKLDIANERIAALEAL